MIEFLLRGFADVVVWRTMFTVWAFVLACTVVGYAHPKLRAPSGKSVRQAITTWWPVTITAAVGCLCGRAGSVVVLSGVGVLIGREALLLLTPPGLQRRLHMAVVVVAAIGGTIAALTSTSVALVAVVVCLSVPVLQLRAHGHEGFARTVPAVVWAALLAGVLWSFVAQIVVDDAHSGPHGGRGAIAVFFILVMMADAMQYVAGKLFGKTPLAPRTSPKKTVEGLLGGLVIVALLGALLVPSLLGRSTIEGVVVGAAIVVCGLVGDLVMSAFKRDVGIKDSSALLPGQGGALDRCDSIVVCAPLFWWWLQL